ncbi:glucan endo-1,3-beta-glucosidase 5-like [Olea europaea subsp. europaea]|uniref:glucan endo-1,3-beta-D-glucosidase n=1 Tax=Olea europaea subsp. europaea TaxID=158383 RepID=A0A8S0T7F3_OLEEU|nr:glucan endo-1,3-beta-glucosidase 5-like [Olea europaea subsp. europaea]
MGLLGLNFVMGTKILMLFMMVNTVHSIGANWGTQATHPLPPSTVVKLLKDNGIQKVKLFDAESNFLNALRGSGIEVMVGIPNDMLYTLANSPAAAERWVERNVSLHVLSNSVDIRYVAVGNEPFLSTFNGTYLSTTFPALQNIQEALIKAGIGNRVKVTIPLNADVYQSSTEQPSTGDFRPDMRDLMVEIISFMSLHAAPFTVNIYPFISLYNDANFPFDYAFFDGYSSPINDNGNIYTNVFDANYDTLVWALQKNGFGNLSIIVGEIGWPTDGDQNANMRLAQRFNQGFMSHISGNRGTPMRPGPVDAYLFSLIDEDAKSIQPGNFERHWGIFYFDGTPKYNLRLGGNLGGLIPASNVRHLPRRWCVLSPSANLQDPQVIPSVNYACSRADCTSLGYGTSCQNLNAQQNISYAFNSYYQEKNQLDSACRFPNLSVIMKNDPSVGECRFKIMIQTSNSRNGGFLSEPVNILLQVIMLWFTFL